MSIPVWTWTVEYPVKIDVNVNETQIDLGGGIVKTVQHEVPFTNYDGTGQSSDERKETFTFTVRVTRRNYSGDEQFKEIFRFLMARKRAGNESFYFYNPSEKLTPDETGVDTTGRYLVKHLGSISATLSKLTLYDFVDLVFTEDRS